MTADTALSELKKLTAKFHANDVSPLAVFIEQLFAVFRLMIDNPNVRADQVISFDVNPTLAPICTYIGALDPTPEALRLRIKFCGVIEGLSTKASALTMSKDATTRGIILEQLLSWMKPTTVCNSPSTIW